MHQQQRPAESLQPGAFPYRANLNTSPT
jgi:hypothetical protein